MPEEYCAISEVAIATQDYHPSQKFEYPKNTMSRYLLYIFIAIILPGAAAMQAKDLPDDEQFPVAYGPSNMGREFWLAFPSNWTLSGSGQMYIRLYITSHMRTQVKVWVGPSLKRVVETVAGGTAIVDLSQTEAQALNISTNVPVPADRVYSKKALHITAEAPIAIYGVNRTEGTSEGMLALPTSALGHEYIIASYGSALGNTTEMPSQYLITAPYNGTAVTIYHSHRTPNHEPGETFTIHLDSGDVWSAMSLGFGGDMSGTVIKASRPVAVTAGHMCAHLPNLWRVCCCNHLSEMMLPTQAWGKAYHSMPVAQKTKGSFYRVFAKEPNTTVYINGAEYARLTGVGGQEGDGWFEYRAFDLTLQEFAANKPIAVLQYNTSSAYDNSASDPFFLQLPAVEQYQKGITFTVPDKDFPQNYLNLICEQEGFQDIEITKLGSGEWKPLATLANVGVPRPFPLETAGRKYMGVLITLSPGVYSLRGTTPFSGVIYGSWGMDSYGYAVSTGVRNLSRPDFNAPDFGRTQMCDGTVDGVATDLPSDGAVRTNLATVELDPNNSHNYQLILASFVPGIEAQARYKLIVIDKSKPATATVVATDMAGNSATNVVAYDPIRANGLPSSVLPSSQNYGKVRMGEKQRSIITITNESDVSGQFSEIMLRSGVQNFRIIRPTGPVTLGPKGSGTESIEVEVEFTAVTGTDALQLYKDSVGVREECGVRYVAMVEAQVVKPMIRVTDHDFGTGQIGIRSVPWQMEVRNTSPIAGSTLTVTEIGGPKRPDIFDAVSGTALDLPFTLEPNEKRDLQITARAPDEREHRDTIFFTSDAMDVVDGNSYGWLRIRGEAPSSVESTAGERTIGVMEILPNPVAGTATILEYSLERRATVSIELLDVHGRVLRTIQESALSEAGTHRMTLDLSGLSAGAYFARITGGDGRRVRRFTIVR